MGPVWGFLSGWISFFAGFSAPIAAAALAFSEYFAHFFPSFALNASGASAAGLSGWFHTGHGQLLAAGIVILFSVINVLGLRRAAWIQNLLTGLKLAALGLFLCLAFTWGHGSASHFSQVTTRNSPHSLPAQFAVSLVFVMFAYSGWNAATYVSGEIKTPERTIPAALVTGTLTVAALYVLLNAAFIYALPLDSMKGVVAIGDARCGCALWPEGRELFQRDDVGRLAFLRQRHGDYRAACLFCHGLRRLFFPHRGAHSTAVGDAGLRHRLPNGGGCADDSDRDL